MIKRYEKPWGTQWIVDGGGWVECARGHYSAGRSLTDSGAAFGGPQTAFLYAFGRGPYVFAQGSEPPKGLTGLTDVAPGPPEGVSRYRYTTLWPLADGDHGDIPAGSTVTVQGGKVTTVETPDPVNHPSHYKSGGFETIDVIEAWGLDFCLANTVKYISRAGKKDPSKEVEDLKKAAWYLARRIKQLEGA